MPTRKLVLSIALAALIVTAGCSTFIPGSNDAGDTAPADATTTADSHDHDDHDHNADDQDQSNSETTSDYNLNKKLYADGQFLGDRIIERHTQIIESASSYKVAIHQSHSFPVDGEDKRGSTSSVKEYSYNLDTREFEAVIREQGVRSETYQSPTADYMVRQQPDGTNTYFGGNATDDLTPYSHPPKRLMHVATHTTLSFQGKGTIQGHTGYIYTASEASAFAPSAFQQFPFTTDQLESGQFTAIIGEDGVIKLLQLKAAYQTDAGMESVFLQKSFSHVNDVHPGKPMWVENAKQALENPDPDDYITQTMFEEGSHTGVVVSITAQKQAFDANAVFHRYTELPDSAPDALKKAAVGSAFTIHYPPDQTERIQGTIQYDADHTPDNKGNDLTVVVYNEAKDRVFLLENIENRPRSEDMKFQIGGEYKYGYEGQYIVLIHNPTYQYERQD